MPQTIDDIFYKLKDKLLSMPKYNPIYHLNKRISEKDFHTTFIDILTKEDNWSQLQKEFSEKILKNNTLTVKELMQLEAPIELPEVKEEIKLPESRTSNFTDAQMKRMMQDARSRENGIPRDARGLERDDEKEHACIKKEETIKSNNSPQPKLPTDSTLEYISKDTRKKQLQDEYLASINKKMLR